MKQLKARILSNDEAASGYYRMRLSSGYLARNSKPGQFVEIRCAGLTDPLLRRPLGIHRTWSDGVEILYEVVGRGTELLAGLRAGRELDLIGPLGNGFDLNPACDVNILVAGGIGAAPLLALAEKLAYGAERIAYSEKKRRKSVHVFLGARTKAHIVCEKEFKSLGCKVEISTDDGSRGYRGFVTEPVKRLLASCKPETYLPAFRRVAVYACGPNPMLKAVSAIALGHGIPCQVSLEERMACGVGVCLGCPVQVKSSGGKGIEYRMVCKDGPVFNAGEIAW